MQKFQPEEGKEEVLEEKIKEYQEKISRMISEIHKVVVGQEEVVNEVITALICDAHALLEGVPGLAKSLLVETISKTIEGTTFRRIQFVPDMLPSDIIGVNVFDPIKRDFYIVKGPIFANFILADEINRAPPKTQAAMMEAMQEKKVNIHNQEFTLERPFLVLATQNPLEQQGVYPLPEAVIDRFFLKILVEYPKWDEELEIIDRNTVVNYNLLEPVQIVFKKEEIVEVQHAVRKIYIAKPIKEYILKLITTTRSKDEEEFEYARYIRYGASPRGTISLALAARAHALMQGRNFVIPDDVKAMAKPVLRHRIILNYEGKAAGINTDEIVEYILKEVSPP